MRNLKRQQKKGMTCGRSTLTSGLTLSFVQQIRQRNSHGKDIICPMGSSGENNFSSNSVVTPARDRQIVAP